jgi:hypothetical protein
MKNYINKITLFIMAMVVATSCDYEEQFDPNNPSTALILNNASKATLQGVVTGLEARHRVYFTNSTQMFGSFGREVWAFFGSDPRFINDWLGVSGTTYPDFFASNGTYLSPYQAVLQANTLIAAVDPAVNTNLTIAEANGYSGFAKTIKAFQLSYPPLDPGPIVDRVQALAGIRAILDEGFTELQNGEISFSLTSGWGGFTTAAQLGQVNRAIAARLAVYAEDYSGALSALNSSFLDLNDARSEGAMTNGPMLVYGEAPDVNNPLFYPLDANTSTILVVHPSVTEDNIASYGVDANGDFNDLRAKNKFYLRADPAINATIGSEFPGDYQDLRWPTNTDPIPFIRNEELILLYAEAQWMSGNQDEAIRALNNVRNTWNVGDTPITTTSTDDAFTEELLDQRRYSLWAEAGHRWVDLRRLDKLDAAHIDLREGGSIFTQVDRRISEQTWEDSTN